MSKRKAKEAFLEKKLEALNQLISEDLSLRSLRDHPPRVQGYAYRFFLVLPLFCAEGKPVFTDDHLGQLTLLFDTRFGGCLASTARSGTPYFGEYMPEGSEPVRDYHTGVIVYANPIEASDRFFTELKSILKKAPLIEQDEILIERTEVFLM